MRANSTAPRYQSVLDQGHQSGFSPAVRNRAEELFSASSNPPGESFRSDKIPLGLQAVKQVRHYLRNGAMDIGEVPMPTVGCGDVLVRNHYSFVSNGTEKVKLAQARMSLVQKARERPDQVKRVLSTFREQGLIPTLRKSRDRLNAPTGLGYSCAGTVAAVG